MLLLFEVMRFPELIQLEIGASRLFLRQAEKNMQVALLKDKQKQKAYVASICARATRMVESSQLLLTDGAQIAEDHEDIYDDLTSATAESAALLERSRVFGLDTTGMLMIHCQETMTLFEPYFRFWKLLSEFTTAQKKAKCCDFKKLDSQELIKNQEMWKQEITV
jgi:hypothetical protein